MKRHEALGTVEEYVNNFAIVRRPPPLRRRRTGNDPLSQSFTVDETGAFMTVLIYSLEIKIQMKN